LFCYFALATTPQLVPSIKLRPIALSIDMQASTSMSYLLLQIDSRSILHPNPCDLLTANTILTFTTPFPGAFGNPDFIPVSGQQGPIASIKKVSIVLNDELKAVLRQTPFPIIHAFISRWIPQHDLIIGSTSKQNHRIFHATPKGDQPLNGQ
jgi:hypothetical protein